MQIYSTTFGDLLVLFFIIYHFGYLSRIFLFWLFIFQDIIFSSARNSFMTAVRYSWKYVSHSSLFSTC